MYKIKEISITIMILFVIIITNFSGCIKEDLQLDNVEINEYQGENLGSIYDFRENSIKGPQYISKNDYKLIISGLVKQKINLTYNEIINDFKHYKKLVTLNCVEGWSVKILWEGILIKDLINLTNITNNASTLIFHAYDGYTTSLPLNYILDNNIIIAFKMNNVTIPPERGFPFQLVAEGKWGYKWVKWITEIEISDNELFEGYWESRGYSNNADLNQSFIE
jgi:DMSO/TMAO reductase YedYZ molybdopterin-dependent catalytic subunit